MIQIIHEIWARIFKNFNARFFSKGQKRQKTATLIFDFLLGLRPTQGRIYDIKTIPGFESIPGKMAKNNTKSPKTLRISKILPIF